MFSNNLWLYKRCCYLTLFVLSKNIIMYFLLLSKRFSLFSKIIPWKKKWKQMFNLKGSKSAKMKKKTPTTIWTPSQRRGNVDIPPPITMNYLDKQNKSFTVRNFYSSTIIYKVGRLFVKTTNFDPIKLCLDSTLINYMIIKKIENLSFQ